ncbi:tetratricopeptide repeat protein [Tateyamaria sp. ANG-S1]|uniref:tetratricopeptide repeat protein n=1 Tax=Tateyamaria sp. ANG-S1 TaxID=1577905 RepID=UPI0019D40758|nr:tetratricopeptide repeat protein [Tateyamaria sp. ANG-S1]
MDRAAVEFRNVFRFDGEHEDARRQLAQILEAQGKTNAAYGQYLRLAEQYPDLADVRQALARMAIALQNWDEAERHGRRAIELAPEAPITQPIRVALDYRQAALDESAAKRTSLAEEAKQLLQADPIDLISRRLLIAHELYSNRPSAAILHLDAAIAQEPNELRYYVVKLQALQALQDDFEVEQLLQTMFKQFPTNETVQQSLITFYLHRENFDQAEAFLRNLAGEDTGETEGFVTLIQLIRQARGRDAALAEVERLIAANAEEPDNQRFYRALRASFDYENGNTQEAIAALQNILTDAPDTDQTRQIKGTLATMLLRSGNQVGGRALIEQILASDTSNVAALKLRAELLIQGDKAGEAIIDLRRALDQSPRDTSILLLLARAHERNGSIELQGERLATAVDVSNAGTRESLLYANFLLRNDRREAARTVLADARNANPTNVDVLGLSAQLALEDNALGLVRGIIADLQRISDEPRAPDLLQGLRSALLLQQDRVDEGLAILQQQAGSGGANTRAVYAVIQTQLRTGRVDEARTYLDGLLQGGNPDRELRRIDAALNVAEGNSGESETILRALIAEEPDYEPAITQLYAQLRSENRLDDASALLSASLTVNSEAPRLLALQARELERQGNIEGAIEIYETLYTLNTDNLIIANNLASLLSTFRDDPESQARAATVARRLRGTDVPALQDTYGWIAFQQGDLDEALAYLEPAAAGLPNNPLVQFHLGMTYAALNRNEAAQAALNQAIELAGPDTTLPQIARARDALQSLQNN